MLDIRSIPGVSAAEARSLAALSLHSTDDLLRTNRAELVRRLPRLTLPRVVSWQAFAALAEIRACDELCGDDEDEDWLCC